MDCTATMIPSLSITGRHPRPTVSPVGRSYPSVELQSAYSTVPTDRATLTGTITRGQSDLGTMAKKGVYFPELPLGCINVSLFNIINHTQTEAHA